MEVVAAGREARVDAAVAAEGARVRRAPRPGWDATVKKEVVFGHFGGLSLGTILLTSAETFTDPGSARASLRESFSKTRETVVSDVLK